eukprot:CAMPEP_0119429222 /NCGR_PEP_ID=MMETSP1335-20130426/41829_1 /TAXON_ID=259385 /ORGANISM="Chrysoculter rhomboideus, Strain RCC1486" /LENGTH=198 /DNA_ID=CAMNT_0007454935 /DNA_START=231 /DNA_END=824 /DNA_ORIENTATION=+
MISHGPVTPLQEVALVHAEQVRAQPLEEVVRIGARVELVGGRLVVFHKTSFAVVPDLEPSLGHFPSVARVLYQPRLQALWRVGRKRAEAVRPTVHRVNAPTCNRIDRSRIGELEDQKLAHVHAFLLERHRLRARTREAFEQPAVPPAVLAQKTVEDKLTDDLIGHRRVGLLVHLGFGTELCAVRHRGLDKLIGRDEDG